MRVIHTDIPEGVVDFIKRYGNVMTDGRTTYFHLPLYFEQTHDGTISEIAINDIPLWGRRIIQEPTNQP